MNNGISTRSRFDIERCVNELEVWDQIRRTEEELMERGTMEEALLQDHHVEAEGTVSKAAGVSRIGA